jgi:hypothetical protein
VADLGLLIQTMLFSGGHLPATAAGGDVDVEEI